MTVSPAVEVFAKTLFSVYKLADQQGACAGLRQIYLRSHKHCWQNREEL